MQIRSSTTHPFQGAVVVTLILALAACSSSQPAAAPAVIAPTTQAATGANTSASPVQTARATPSVTASATHKPKIPARPIATKPAPASARFPVAVSLGNASQVITVVAHGSYATVTAWQYAASGWHPVIATTAARVGANGVVSASIRRQGTNTTPAGTFTLTQAFGIGASPGARLAYHQVTPHDWWVEDNLSAYYNQMRTDAQGGFNTSLPESSVNGSERLITHNGTYQYAVVIDFNRWPAVRYRGAGIFLHVNGSGATAGCVSVPLSTMVELLRWLNPAAHPRIAIG